MSAAFAVESLNFFKNMSKNRVLTVDSAYCVGDDVFNHKKRERWRGACGVNDF
jgi:hypothetical protein